jgi:hypothetical protein
MQRFLVTGDEFLLGEGPFLVARLRVIKTLDHPPPQPT